jgi:transglutaminase-like putative cysteine protease
MPNAAATNYLWGQPQSQAGATAPGTQPSSAAMLASVFGKDNQSPFIQLVTRVKTKNRQTRFGDITQQNATWTRETADNLNYYKRSTRWLPTDGIVKATALKVTQGAKTDAQKAKLIYDWVVANTYREVKVRGCGEGDIKSMLETGNLGGKCGDLSALFVGLARAAGVPALWRAVHTRAHWEGRAGRRARCMHAPSFSILLLQPGFAAAMVGSL